ncbi:hypothetical protein F1721_16375 [Saccharopolyspora hirsuta]|uniref:Uncharacterized protein n=1 Tax=Saccharopolyspora hirsuta TaxID=1837 RepID=A0A5M7BWS1_SACHI|nr:hypothetical protein [Saccharopolyspora hirsuta]KAA5832578.1 hypothetical protein F1721_16375 [Saccharopolyspora hirsuta]
MPTRTSPEQLATSRRNLFRIFAAAALTGVAMYVLEQNLVAEPGSPLNLGWLLAGYLAMVSGMLGHVVLRRSGLNDKPATLLAAAGCLALFPLLWWLLVFARSPHEVCTVRHPDGIIRNEWCLERIPGTYDVIPDNGGPLGLALLAAAAIVLVFIGIGYALGRTNRRRTVPLRWYLITGALWSAVPATQLALNLANTPGPERLWIVLTATVISAVGLTACFHQKRQRDQSARGEGE